MSQHCSNCTHESPDGTKFCPECGTPFAKRCTACQHPVGTAKFCPECGTPVAGAAPASSPPGGHSPLEVTPVSERRTTSVLFGDLVSFTTLSEHRDPEEVRELLSEYFAVARTVVGRYGGTIEKFIGDAVMAVWGVPVSMEDDAERAVRAGLDLVREVTALGAKVGAPDLGMRVGVTTGAVAVTLGALNEGMVAGDAVNTAARVQTEAEPGTVWVDAETRGLTAAAVAYSDMGERILKGRAEPARLFRADAVVAAVGGAQRVDGLEAPMTGRDDELRQVKELFHATETDGKARIAIVTGQAGIGKSRLGWEYEKYADGISGDVKWHRGRSMSYGEGVAFWSFAEMMRSRLGLLETDDRATTDLKVAQGVREWAADEDEAAWLAPRLSALLNPGDGVVFDRTDLFATWTTFLERVGRGGVPVVLLFEDAQHADSGLLDLIEHLLETARVGLFVLVLARPELLELRPSLASGRRATVISLEPLTDADMATLVDDLVADLPGHARNAIVERAEGVPLYAVETVRTLIDRDAVVASEGRYVFTDQDGILVDLDQLSAPTSLQMLISARLDALTALERRTVQNASVLGMSFRPTGLLALDDVSAFDLEATLASLVRKGVLDSQNDARSPELGQFRFQQALVREVAYATLARKDRRARHLAAASRLESEADEAAASLDAVIAQHLIDALASTGADDPERGAIAARARMRLASAAEKSLALGSPAEALGSLLAAVALDPDPDERATLLADAARAANHAGDNERAGELATAASAQLEGLGRHTDQIKVRLIHARTLMNRGRFEEAAVLIEWAEEKVSRHSEANSEQRFDAVSLRMNIARARSDREQQMTAALESCRIAEEIQNQSYLIRALNGLAIALVDLGTPTAYRAVLNQCLQIAREQHHLAELGRTLSNLLAEEYPTDLVRAMDLVEECVEVTKRTGDAYYTEVALTNAAFTWWLSGDWDRLTASAAEWLDAHEPTGSNGSLWLMRLAVAQARGLDTPPVVVMPSEDPWERAAAEVALAVEEARDGDVRAAAARPVASMAECFGGVDGMREDFEVLLAPSLELQLQAGDLATARQLLELDGPLRGTSKRALLRGEAARLAGMIKASAGEDPEADFREAELAHAAYGAPFLLARSRHEFARWLIDRGRRAEAEVLLDRARETYDQLGAATQLADVAVLAGDRVEA